jgi:hypothetical protein
MWSGDGGARALAEGFERACGAAIPVCRAVRLAGRHVSFRVAGDLLARETLRPFAHLGERLPAPDGGPPALSIDAWDEAATGVTCPVPAESVAAGVRQWASGGGTFTASLDGRYLGYRHEGSASVYDRAARRIVACRTRGSEFSSNARVKPFAIHLATWLSDEGVHEVHAALVAREGRGVLMAGASGAGKSTSAMACVRGGLDFLGDDIVGVEETEGGAFVGHSLFGGVCLDPDAFERLGMRGTGAAGAVAIGNKVCVFPYERWAGRVPPSVPLAAVVLPRLGGSRMELRPARRSAVLLALATSSYAVVVPRPGAAAMDAIARLAERLPGYWMDLGSEASATPGAIADLLADLAGASMAEGAAPLRA